MNRRAVWARYGLGLGADREPDRRVNRSRGGRSRKVEPVEAPTVPTYCERPTCPNERAPLAPGRLVCADCAAAIDTRAVEHRRRVV